LHAAMILRDSVLSTTWPKTLPNSKTFKFLELQYYHDAFGSKPWLLKNILKL